MNFASRYAQEVDERFNRASQAMLALNNNYKFTGVKTVNVYSIPTVPMTDYNRTGSFGTSRYGTPTNLQPNIQSLTINRDRSFTFTIDKGDKLQSELVLDAGKALARQTTEVAVPEYDTYVFRTLAAAATAHGNYSTTAITTGANGNAYEVFLDAMEHLGNRNVPEQGRVCFCSYKYANQLMLDPAFIKNGDRSQELVLKGVLGELDGCRIVKVPASRLPAGAAFLLVHPMAATAPKMLEEFKIHDDPPGESGWLIEGRYIYDCFVLDQKADAIYYHGSQAVLQPINVYTTPSETSGSTVVTTDPAELEAGKSFYYQMKANEADLDSVEHGTAITAANWTLVKDASNNPIPVSGATLAAATNKWIAIVEVNTADKKPVAYGKSAIKAG